MRRWSSVAGLLLACLVLLTGVADAEARKPVFVSFSVTPTALPASGGNITVTARVRNATACVLWDMPPVTRLPCTSGRVVFHRHVSANRGAVPDVYASYIEAFDGRQQASSRIAQIEVLPTRAAPPPVANLDVCETGPECDYGASYQTFQTYGNTTTLGDCAFAAAADWEQIVLGDKPEPEQIAYEFGAAGGTEDGGLAQTAFMNYWRKDGSGESKSRALNGSIRLAETSGMV